MATIPSTSQDIPLDKIVMSTSQARQRDTKVEPDDDLVLSIRKHGLISPVVVKQVPDNDQYELLIGQRRYRAHVHLKLPTIKAYVVGQDMNESNAKMLSIIENVARKDMKNADLVDAVEYFMDKYNSTSDVAEELGLHPNTIRKYVNAARLPQEIREDVRNKNYRLGHALKALKALGDDETAVDTGMLRETALEMKKLSPQGRDKFVEIKEREPDSTPQQAAEKARQRTSVNIMQLHFTDDQGERIDRYKKRQDIEKDEEAVVELVDIGLDTADV